MANIYYSNARARSQELKLLGIERINRMIEAETPDGVLKILSEVNFGEGLIIDSALDFEKLISAEMGSLSAFIRECSPTEAFKKFTLLKNDFHNAEAIVRNKYLKIDETELLTENGLIDVDELKDKILVDDYSSFPKELATALMKADELFVSNKATGALLDDIFIKGLYSALLSATKGHAFLRKMVVFKIDALNLGIAFRLKNYNKAKEFFIDGGKLSKEELSDICELSLDEIKHKFSFNIYSNLINSAIFDKENNESLSAFEKAVDDYPMQLLLKEKYTTSKDLPFIQYCYYKLADVSNFRLIIVGAINKVNKEEIRKRLRIGYEG